MRWVGETPPAIAIAECEKAEGARAEGGERKRKRAWASKSKKQRGQPWD